MALVEQEIKEAIGIITLNNSQKRNSLSEPLVEGLIQSLDAFRESKVPVVILRAAEDCKVWSAGHDVKELPRSLRDPLGYFDPLERVLRAVQEYPGPVIAMVHGGVWGGACDLVMCCDMVVGDETATFAITPAKLGLPYNVSGILHFVNRVGLNIAKEMFFAAEPFPAERAERVGILNHRVSADELLPFTMGLAKTIASRSALSVSVIKEQFRILSGSRPLSPEVFEHIQVLRRRVYDSHDYQEGITSFLEKRSPVFTGN
jgi:methylmalonyl-CoA decarboxylase